MKTLRTTFAIALLTLSVSFAAGCASEECEGDQCSIYDPSTNDPTSNDPVPSTCGEQCAHLEGCDYLNALECTAVCQNQTFSAREMACLAKTECGDGLMNCLELENPGLERF